MCRRPIHNLFSKDGDEGLREKWWAAAWSLGKRKREVESIIQMLRNEEDSLSSEITLLERPISDLIVRFQKLRSLARVEEEKKKVHMQDGKLSETD